MALAFLIPIAFLALGVYLLLSYVQATRRPPNYPPGPAWLPVVGNMFTLRRLSRALGGQHLALQRLAKTHGSDVLGLKLGGDLTVYVQGHRLVHHALTTDEFEGRPNNFFAKMRCMGEPRGVTCLDGPLWRSQRSFVERRLRSAGYGKPLMEARVQAEVPRILELLGPDAGPVQVGPVVAPAVLTVLWTLATGCSLSRDDLRIQHFLHLINARSKVFDMLGGTLSQLPWLRYLIPERIGYNMLVKLNIELKSYFSETIQEHHDTWYADREDDLIYSFITEMKNNDESTQIFTNRQLIMLCLDLFFGGATTASDTLDFIFLEMILNRDIQEKAFNCINSAIPPGELLTYADRLKVPYVEAVIMESGRMHSLTPITAPKRVLRDTILDGYHLPKNTTVLLNFQSIQNDAEYWGDPDVFRPERFIDENGQLLSGERLLTFGLGRRRCLGELLARQCVFLFFTAILRKYKICPEPGVPLPSRTHVPGVMYTAQKI